MEGRVRERAFSGRIGQVSTMSWERGWLVGGLSG